MNLNSQYYSYCKEIGVMKENYGRQRALDAMKESVRKVKSVDPEFVKEFDKVTLSYSGISYRVCMLYKWDINLDYVVNGVIKHGRIADFGESGAHKDLHITNFGDNASYTKLNDFSSINYSLYNNDNIFTYEQMKSALKGVINKQVPRGTTSYESTNWSISAYAVPVMVIFFQYKGKTYNFYYNLQNGHYHYAWETDPALIARGKKAKKVGKLMKTLALIATIFFAILGFATEAYFGAVVSLIFLVVQIIIMKKSSHSKSFYENYFVNNPNKSVKALLKAAIANVVFAGLSFFATIIAMMGSLL